MDRVKRIEENERLFREVNERVAQMQIGFGSGRDPEWVCECGDETCFDKLTVPMAEYEAVRAHGNWFIVKPGHEKLDVERVVRDHDRYLVVEKDGLPS